MLEVLPVFIGTRLLFVLLTYFGVILFTLRNYSPKELSTHILLFSWYRWDVDRFATIAIEGYKQFDNTAFFPLFPLLEYIVSVVLHKSILVSGMLISNLAFLAALVVLYRFVETEFDSDTAKRTALYISIYPTAFFFFAAYNESLFMLFMLLSYYAMRRGSWWLAGLFGGLATLTRSIGLLLLAVFLYEFVRQVLPRLRQTWREKQHWRSLRMLSALLAALPIPLALGIFSYYLYTQFHDPLAFTHSQAHWHLGPTFPWVALGTSINLLLTVKPYTFAIPHILIELTSVAFSQRCSFFVSSAPNAFRLANGRCCSLAQWHCYILYCSQDSRLTWDTIRPSAFDGPLCTGDFPRLYLAGTPGPT